VIAADDLITSNEIASIDEVVALDEIAKAYTTFRWMLQGSPAAYTKMVFSVADNFLYPLIFT
jgi:hypothetical protein